MMPDEIKKKQAAQWAVFELSKFKLGSQSESNKTKEMNY